MPRVEQYLTTLYDALDGPHQQLEHELRGDYMPGGALSSNPNQDFLTPEPSEFAPPFSAPQRFALGDLNATAGAIRTNAQNISKTWSDFGKKLKNNAERTKLEKETVQKQAQIKRLTDRVAELEQASSTNFVGVTNPKAEIRELNNEIVKLEQQVAENQIKLAEANTP